MMTIEELYVLRVQRDSILEDRKALRNLERKERYAANAKNKGLLHSLYRGEFPENCGEEMTRLRESVYEKQRRYLESQAELEKELSRIPSHRVRVALSLYFVDLISMNAIAKRLGKKTGSFVLHCRKEYLRGGMENDASEPKEKTLLRELNEFRFAEAQIERLRKKLKSPVQFPDFFLPFEEDTQVPAAEVWKEELETLTQWNLGLISYIEGISDPWIRNIFQARFIDGKELREVARAFGETKDSIVSIIRSYLHRHPKGFLSVKELAELWGVGKQTVQRYCLSGRIPGAVRRDGYEGVSGNGRVWSIPADISQPQTRRELHPEGYLSCRELAERWGVRETTIAHYCRQGKLPGAVKRYGSKYNGRSEYFWSIPSDVSKPETDNRRRNMKGYLSCDELANLWGMSASTVSRYCRQGKLPGAVLKGGGRGGLWLIPPDVPKPELRQKRNAEGYLSVREIANLWGVSVSVIQKYCKRGQIPGAALRPDEKGGGRTRLWSVPAAAQKPDSLLQWERRKQKEGDVR